MAGRLMVALLGIVGAEKPLTSAFGRWARHVSEQIDNPVIGDAHAVSLLHAASGEVQISSPEGQYCLALSQIIDTGGIGIHNSQVLQKIGALSGQRGRGPLWDWYWHNYVAGIG